MRFCSRSDTDWVNSPTASTCFYCHDSDATLAHMRQNGGTISVADPAQADFTQRQEIDMVESCTVCHGAGRSSGVDVVHGLR